MHILFVQRNVEHMITIMCLVPLFCLIEGNVLAINLEITDNEHLNASFVWGSVRLDCNSSDNLSKFL